MIYRPGQLCTSSGRAGAGVGRVQDRPDRCDSGLAQYIGDPDVVTLLFFDPNTGIGRLLLMDTNLSGRGSEVAMYAIWNTLAKYEHRVGR
jgi:hypothetical protein